MLCATDKHKVADLKIRVYDVGAFVVLIDLLLAFFCHLFRRVLVHAGEAILQHISGDKFLCDNAVEL